MDAPLPEAEPLVPDEASPVRAISRAWKKDRRRAWWKGALITAAVCAVLAGLWAAATQLNLFPVDPAKIEITDVRQLRDGRIVYHFYIDDDLGLHQINYEYDDEGNMYCIPVRALITERRWEGNSPSNMDRILDLEWVSGNAEFRGAAEVTRVWYGQGEDAVLLWEEGMDLPAASEADEAAWGYEPGSAAYWAERCGETDTALQE